VSEAEHVYTSPQAAAAGAMPDEVKHFLDGSDLPAKTQALRLVVFPQSKTTANLVRDGRVTMTLALDGGMGELQMRARRLAHSSPDVPLAFFEAEVETVRIHKAPYAAITSGITFALHEPEAVLARWQRQISALRLAS
jgi:hypothetical protein